MAIILRNNSNRRVMFDLPHEVVCKGGECSCETVERASRDHNVQTGEVGLRTSAHRIPRGVILSGRGSSEPLPDSIADVPIIRDLLRAGTLVQVKDDSPKPRRDIFTSSPSGSSGT